MRYILFLLVFLPFLASAQPSEVAAKKIRATEKLQLDTATLTQIVRVISAASTHSQSPTAKAVYDFVSSLPGGSTDLSFSGTSSPVTLNSSTGADVTLTAGSGIGLSATGANLTVANTAPDQTVTIAGATGIYPIFTLPDASSTNELQSISTTGAAGNITLSNGGGTLNLNVNDADASTTNELQNLSLTGQVLGITGGTSVTLPLIGVAAGTGVSVSTTSGITTVINTGDLSTTNELQTLSYSAPNLSLSGGGGSVAIPQGTVTGTGTTNYLSKFSGSSALANSQIFDNGTNVGIGTTTMPEKLTVNGNVQLEGAYPYFALKSNLSALTSYFKNGVSASGASAGNYTTILNPSSLGWSFSLGGTPCITVTPTTGNVGIKNASPFYALDVVGNARFSGLSGAGNRLLYTDLDGLLVPAAIGTGLSFSGGTLSVTSASKWTSGAGGIYNTDLNNVSVGATAVNLSRFRVSGNSANTCARFDAGALPDFGAVTQLTGSGGTIYGNNYSLNATGNATYLFANSNAGVNANSLVQFQANGGSPFTQYQLTNGSGAVYAVGIDNSATGDPFKIKSGANLIGLNGITMLSNGFIGINDDAPNTTLDVEGTDGIDIPNGTTAERPTGGQIVRFNSSFGGFEALNNSNNVWYRVSSTTSPTASWNSGVIGSGGSVSFATGSNEVAGTIIITAGTAPTGTNVSAISITFPNAYNGGVTPFPIICQANAITATEWNKFHVGTSNSTLFQIGVAAQLAAGTTYRINYRITQ